MNQITEGFILSKHQIERKGQTFLEFWLASDNGCHKVITPAQEFVFFVTQSISPQCEQILNNTNIAFQAQNISLKTYNQAPVAAFYFATSKAFFDAKEQLKRESITLLEDDIRLADRFLMERFTYASAIVSGIPHRAGVLTEAKVKSGNYKPNLSVLSLDIECSEKGELYSIGLAAQDYECVIMIGAPAANTPKWIIWVPDELSLLQQFIAAFNSFDPDIVIGWSVISFDFRLLIRRAEKHKLALTISRDGSTCTWREGKGSQQGFLNLAGRVVLDGIDSLKSATYQFDSFSLESVSQELLGKGKKVDDVSNRMAHINHDFKHNKVKLAEYNLQDCILVLEIFEHTNLLDFLILRSQLTGLDLDRAGGSVAAFTNLYLPKLHRAGYVAPNLPKGGGLASPGGYVMNSLPGLYKNVLVLDFKSLYPSIIRTFKIDPLGLIEGLLTPDNAIPGFKGAYFDREKHFLPDIITQLWKQRDEAKKARDEARSQAIKILMNSFYGVLGSGGCRFYDTRLASSITMRGHEIMQTTAKWIEEQGHKVIYGDTDSTFVWIGDEQKPEEAQEIGNDLAEMVNQNWHDKLQKDFGLDCYLELEFETHFSQFLMPTIRGSETGSKKRYAGLKHTKNGEELVFKGLETVRSDWTKLAKNFQTTLYQMVFDGKDVNTYIQDIIEKTRSGLFDEQLIYRKRLRQALDKYVKNVPPHVKAARIADERNAALGKQLQYQRKGWIKYVITTNGPEPLDYIESQIDYEHYVEKQIRPIAEGILPFINLDFDQITSAQLGLF
ncbi:MAG: DNA polymerase II [Alteromonadaceae bacterium]|nr:DNA polymerase II [Alteromonadaceae bacterium]